MKNYLKKCSKKLYRFGNTIGLFNLFDKLNSNAHRVITYHGIVHDNSETLSGMDITQNVFEKNISFFSRYYNIKPLNDCSMLNNTISITFDDGCLSDLTRAVPILSKYGVSATFFVCSDIVAGKYPATWNDLALAIGFELSRRKMKRVSTKELFQEAVIFAQNFETFILSNKIQDPYLYLNEMMSENNMTNDIVNNLKYLDSGRFTPLNEADIRKIIESGHEIGSHTSSHAILSHISHDKNILSHELLASKKYIESIIGVEVNYLSYPFGGITDVNQTAEDFAKSSGYKRAYYNLWTNNCSIYSSPRMSIQNTTDELYLHAVASGFYHFMKTGSLL